MRTDLREVQLFFNKGGEELKAMISSTFEPIRIREMS